MNDRVHPNIRTHSLESPTGGVPATLVGRGSTVADALIRSLEAMGVRHAFGVIDGSVAPLYGSLQRSEVELVDCRHENGAAFVAHVAIPASVQVAPAPISLAATTPYGELLPDGETMDEVVERLRRPFAVWVGFGCRYAAPELYALVELTEAPVMATPRGKGIFPEDDPAYLGVTGLGGHANLARRLRDSGVETVLVLGTRLAELSSFHDPELVPRGGLVHVDLDPEIPGSAYPEVDTLAVRAEIGGFLRHLLMRYPELGRRWRPITACPAPERLEPRSSGRVRPSYLMQCMQDRLVEGSDAVVLSESGNSFVWTNHYLRFTEPLRYRGSGLSCPMGHVSAGALGTAMASGKRAVALVGDGALLRQNELSTAAQIRANAAWIVLNNARYGISEQGRSGQGYPSVDFGFPEVDFAGLAHSLGVEGLRVEREDQLEEALARLSSSQLPFVLDVLVDPSELAPLTGGRVYGVDEQRSGSRERRSAVRRTAPW